MKRFLRKFINFNIKLSDWFDSLFLPKKYCIDGLKDYVTNVVPKYLKQNQNIIDVGGGKRPYIGTEQPRKNDMKITGIDISKKELSLAPKGMYDKVIAKDIGKAINTKDLKADIVICEAVLEHVQDTETAVKNISNMLVKNGIALIFIPCKNAPFARLNILLPQAFKKRLLFILHPNSRYAQGFPAYYNNCTPNKMINLFTKNNTKRVEVIKYNQSNYFTVFFPLHVLWRLLQLIKGLLGLDNCESFTMIAKKVGQ